MTAETNVPLRPYSLATIGGLAVASLVAQLLPPRQSQPPRRDATRATAHHSHPKPVVEPEVRKETLFQIAKNVLQRIGNDNLMLVAAGCAFYAMTAIFPAIAAFVSIFGLFADPHAVEAQIRSFSSLLPPEAMKLLIDAVNGYVGKNPSTLNVALVVSLALALWTAKAGVASLMTGLNIANEQPERRGFFVQQFVGLALTLGAIVFAVVALAAIALLPVIVGFLPLGETIKGWVEYGRWPLLALVVAFSVAVFYRFGASRETPRWRWVTWGAAVATVLWLICSAGFSFYVSNFASYDKTYGSLAAPVILLLWFWVSALVVLVGAEVDAELEYADGRRARPIDESDAR